MQWDQLQGLLCKEMVILPFRLESFVTSARSPQWAHLAAFPYSEFGVFSETVGLVLANTIRRIEAPARGVEYGRRTKYRDLLGHHSEPGPKGSCQGLCLNPSFWSEGQSRGSCPLPLSLVLYSELQRGRALICKEGNPLWTLFIVGPAFLKITQRIDLCLTIICSSKEDHEKHLNYLQSSPERAGLSCMGLLPVPASNHSFAKPRITWWETGMLLRFRFWQGWLM